MEVVQIEKQLDKPQADLQEQLRALNELELACVGGGVGDVIVF